jgi:hypothetical protein
MIVCLSLGPPILASPLQRSKSEGLRLSPWASSAFSPEVEDGVFYVSLVFHMLYLVP